MNVFNLICSLVWISFSVLSVFVIIWNYVTKCDLKCGQYVRVYSVSGLVLRLFLALLIFPINFIVLFAVVTEAIDGDWLNKETKEDCRRNQFYQNLSRHKLI